MKKPNTHRPPKPPPVRRRKPTTKPPAKASALAKAEAQKSAQVATFLKELFANIDPRNTKGRDTTMLRAIADNAEKRLSAQMKDQPEFEAEMRDTLGEVYGRRL